MYQNRLIFASTVDWVSNSLDSSDTPSYSGSHPDRINLHINGTKVVINRLNVLTIGRAYILSSAFKIKLKCE